MVAPALPESRESSCAEILRAPCIDPGNAMPDYGQIVLGCRRIVAQPRRSNPTTKEEPP